MTTSPTTAAPRIAPLGLDGLLVSFSDALGDAANRAALAFRAAVEAEGWEGVRETASTLASTYIAHDPEVLPPAMLRGRIEALTTSRDWSRADLPAGRRRFILPACFEGDHAPQLAEAAELAGRSPGDALAELCARPLRALALGFAPGQAYLGELPAHWALDRQTGLTPRVETGAVVTAVRQVIVFATSAPTGWRQVAMTRFRAFRPENGRTPIALAPGDEVRLEPIGTAEFDALPRDDPDGGARIETIG